MSVPVARAASAARRRDWREGSTRPVAITVTLISSSSPSWMTEPKMMLAFASAS